MNKKISYTMANALNLCTDGWSKVPSTGMVGWPTLLALKRRGFVEARLVIRGRRLPVSEWQWRKTKQ